jgi:hypothetical protein
LLSDASSTAAQGYPQYLIVSASDPDGDALSWRVAVDPVGGRLDQDGPAVVFTPDPGFTGSATAIVAAFDGQAESCALLQFTVEPGLAPPWTATAIGSLALPFTAIGDDLRMTLRADGADIWGNADQGGFVWQRIHGDVEASLHVEQLAAPNGWGKLGLMMRGATSAQARNAACLATRSNGVVFQRRTAWGGTTAITYGPKVPAPVWLRLRRIGSQISAASSVNGSTWQNIGSATVNLPATSFLGVALASHQRGTQATGVVGAIRIQPLSIQ